MPRRPRICVPNGIYHVTARGNRRQPVFVDAHDHELFLALFAAIRARLGWRCHGYCLMPNHYHLVVQTPDADLSLGMQRLNGEYAQSFNFHHRLDGHVFQGRFHSTAVESDWHLLELSRYLALNPVRAGLAATAAQWRWSSHRFLARGVPAGIVSDEVLGLLGQDLSRAREAFIAFVDGASPVDGSGHVPWGHDGV